MSVERGLGPGELSTVLASRKFAKRVAELAVYTHQSESEGGLCVYKNPATGKLSISQPDLPTAEQREELREHQNYLSSIYDHIDVTDSKNTYHPHKLVSSSRISEVYRRDIAMLIHSHPGGHKHLMPSDRDLESYEDIAGYNPNLIEGILTTSKSRAKIFLYGQTITRYAAGKYKATQLSGMPAQKVRELLAQDGFCTTTVEYEITATPSIVTSPQAAAKRYYI